MTTLTWKVSSRAALAREEEESLLEDHEEGNSSLRNEDIFDPSSCANLPVYTTIHLIRREIIASIDDPYSLEQLRTPRMNIALVRPLVNQLYDLDDISVVYCLLVNRVQFLREQTFQAHHQTVNITRALLCELVANRILRRFDEEHKGPKGLLLLANILVAGFEPFQNAPEEVVQENSHALHWAVHKGAPERKLTALEVAIISESKTFLSSSACQKVVDAIYKGRIIYTPSSFIDILPDHYKRKPISLYDPKKEKLLNQYRLIVPRTRNILEVTQFIILLTLYITVMANRGSPRFSIYELIFSVYAFGWILDCLASILEHGWEVYSQNLWSFLDSAFTVIFGLYFVLRVRGFATDDAALKHTALDILSMGAPVLVPRLAFNLMSENMLFVSLRAMMADFTVLSILAVWCFTGFLLAMQWISNGAHTPITIAKWMVYIWFGLDGTGIGRSLEFHWLLGPILMVTFAFLGNTLFLTILVSMLTNTFSRVVSNATAEIQFRRTVLTFEGVKSDAIFAYQPPVNMLALLFLLPMKFVLSPRWFHKINVAAVRTLNFPLLLIIGFYERRLLWATTEQKPDVRPKRRGFFAFWDFSRFSVHGDIQAVFNSEPPQSVLDEISEADGMSSHALEEAFTSTASRTLFPNTGNPYQRRKIKRESIASFVDYADHPTVDRTPVGGSNISERLDALEASSKKIEDMVRRLCADLGDDRSENSVSLKVPPPDELADGDDMETS